MRRDFQWEFSQQETAGAIWSWRFALVVTKASSHAAGTRMISKRQRRKERSESSACRDPLLW